MEQQLSPTQSCHFFFQAPICNQSSLRQQNHRYATATTPCTFFLSPSTLIWDQFYVAWKKQLAKFWQAIFSGIPRFNIINNTGENLHIFIRCNQQRREKYNQLQSILSPTHPPPQERVMLHFHCKTRATAAWTLT